MSITLNKTKTIHPNRLVTRHEEFLVNKNLAKKVTHVKSTIKADNKHYESILNRRKKDHPRSSQTHLQNPEDHLPEFSSPVADELRIKTSDAQTRNNRLIDPYFLPGARKLHSSTERKHYDTMIGSPSLSLVNSRNSTMTNLNKYNSPKFLGNKLAEKFESVESDLPPVKKEDLLKEKLIEKSKEIEYLKNELKEWWHEDFKEMKTNPSKPNGSEKLAPLEASKSTTKTLRKTFSLKEEFMGKNENNNLAINVPTTSTLPSDRQTERIVKPKEDFIIKKTHVTISTTNKAKSSSEDSKGKIDKSADASSNKAAPKSILKKIEKQDRPSTVKNLGTVNNAQFKVRLSHNAGSITAAHNGRYEENEQFDQITEVEEDQSDSNVFSSHDINALKESQKSQKSQGSAGKKNGSKFFSSSTELTKTDFRQVIDDMPGDDSVLIGEPSPQIAVTAKTLARQSKDLAVARKDRDLQLSEEMIQFGSVNFGSVQLQEESAEDVRLVNNSMQVSEVRIE